MNSYYIVANTSVVATPHLEEEIHIHKPLLQGITKVPLNKNSATPDVIAT
jgi:hypothetical protein